MKKLMFLLFGSFLFLPLSAQAMIGSDTRCFESPEGYGEATIIDRSSGVSESMSKYKEASSSAMHFASCIAVLGSGISLNMVKDTCGCLDAAMDICSPPSKIRDWRKMSSDCKSFFPWGSY